MNAIKINKLTMALGAALVAGAVMGNSQARASEFDDFTRQARAQVMAEATAQPSSAERVRELRGSLTGARVIAGLPDAAEQREQAQATIRAQQLDELRTGTPNQLAGALDGVRVVAGLPSAEEHTRQAVAAIRADQLGDLRRQAPEQLASSLAGAQVTRRIASTGPDRNPGQQDWPLPKVEFKPLIDMSILHFSFRK